MHLRVLTATLIIGVATATPTTAQAPFQDVSLPLIYTKTGPTNQILETDLDPLAESVVLTSSLVSESALPSANPANGRILFSGPDAVTSRPVIYQTGALTSQVTTDEGGFLSEQSPIWGHDGTYFLFVREISKSKSVIVKRSGPAFGAELIIPVTDTVTHKRILHPRISPSGKTLAYVSEEPDGDYRLYRVSPNVFGTTRTLIVDTNTTELAFPTFGPNTSVLMYVRRNSASSNAIHRINLNGTGDTQIKSTTNALITGLQWSRDDSLVAYSLDSTNITLSQVRVMAPTGDDDVGIVAGVLHTYAGVSWGQGYPRIFVRVEDATTNAPIPGATVIARPDGSKAGFELSYFDNGGAIQRYESPTLSPGLYDVAAAAVGYVAAGIEDLPALPGIPQQATIQLVANPSPTALGVLDVTLPIFDSGSTSTGTKLVPDSVTLSLLNVSQPVSIAFLDGRIRAFEVPQGALVLSVDAGDSYAIPDTPIFMALGQRKRVTVPATRIAARPRATIPGQIVGTVMNDAVSPAEPLANARVYFTSDASGLTFYATSDVDGVYFLPDVDAGTGTLQAFSPDQSHASVVEDIDVPSGDVYGDNPPSEVDTLTVTAPPYDTDGDGMDDAYEQSYGLDPTVADGDDGADGDVDVDGARNIDEYVLGTIPTDADSDNDTWTDGQEVAVGTDPLGDGEKPSKVDELWVDFSYEGNDAVGTVDRPYTTLGDSFQRANPGATVQIKGDVDVTDSPESGLTLDQPAVIQSVEGTVSVGSAP